MQEIVNLRLLSQRAAPTQDQKVVATPFPIFLRKLSHHLSCWFLGRNGTLFHGCEGFKGHLYGILGSKIKLYSNTVLGHTLCCLIVTTRLLLGPCWTFLSCWSIWTVFLLKCPLRLLFGPCFYRNTHRGYIFQLYQDRVFLQVSIAVIFFFWPDV